MAGKFYKTVRFYESVVAFKPTLTEEEVQRKLQEVKDFIEKKGGTVLDTLDWGLKQLAYPIQKFNHGRYFILTLKTENPQLTNELDFYYKINEDVIRWMNLQVKEKGVQSHAK